MCRSPPGEARRGTVDGIPSGGPSQGTAGGSSGGTGGASTSASIPDQDDSMSPHCLVCSTHHSSYPRDTR